MKKLGTTKKITHGSMLRMYLKGFGYATLTVIGKSEYYLAGLTGDEFFNSAHEGDQVEGYLWVEVVASYEFSLTIIGKISMGPRILFFSHTDRILRSAERKCLTAQVDIPLEFFPFDPGDPHKGISTEKIVYHTGRVILLTDREATIRSDDDIIGARFLKGNIRLEGDFIELVGMVDTVNESKKIYNLIFSGMHDKERNRILDYVFSHYRE
jgi:hypothetical protein